MKHNIRIAYLDYLRGIAIIFVVMGHLIQYNLNGESATDCFNFIYSYHMGFFFFVSGCTATLSTNNYIWSNFFQFVKKRSIQLLVPFFVWGGITLLLNKQVGGADYVTNYLQILKYPDQSMWFLLFLFFMQLVFFVCCALSGNIKKKIIRTMIILLSVVGVAAIRILKGLFVEGYTWIFEDYYLLFCLGFFVQKMKWDSKLMKSLVFICFLLFVAVAPLFDFNQGGEYTMRMIKIVSSASFSVVLYYILVSTWNNISIRMSKLLAFLGTHTLEIYVTHYALAIMLVTPLIDVSMVNGIPLFFAVMAVSIPLCCLVIKISDVFKTIPLLAFLLYGKCNKQ